MRQKVGVNGLRKHFGGKAGRGTRREKTFKAAGKNIRYCLEQLHQAGLVGEIKYKSEEGSSITMGKSLTKKGTMDMDRIAAQHLGKKKAAK
jgi:ribosomal protein S19E (S16A)